MGKNAINVIKEGKQALDEVNIKLKQTIENVLAINDAALKTSKNFFNIDTPKKLNDALKTNKTYVKQLNAELQERQRLEKALERQLERNKIAESEKAKALAKARFETQQLNRAAREAAVLSSKLSTEYQKQSVKLTQLRRKYKDIALTLGENSKEAQRLLSRITALDNRLKRVDANVGQFQRSVGNYGKAMRSAATAARALAGALGFVGGAFLAVQVIRDAFNRVREFDKAMQNISGIMRVTRKDTKDLEKEIIKVAGASIKTSREVANLAENLVTLGKTKSEILDLLEPVNNLAIGLETTSGEAAEFLVQTLNAFGASSDEAEKYADVIATIRTSTTLDFQKMRDSFQYLTPISRILGKDLAYTGAVIGILADNGLKAEQAGRLLGTAQQKLAKEGRSLAEALEEVNDAQRRGVKEVELLKIASDLFGKQAAKVGVVLANNVDAIEKNSQAIRDNGGALDDLVNEQLKSLDAKLKILDATWESFILSIENGNGALSTTLKFFIDLTTAVIKLNTFLLNNDGQAKQNRIINEQYEATKKLLEVQKQSIPTLETLLNINKQKLAALKTEAKFDNLSGDKLKENDKEQLQQIGILKAIREKIKAQEELNNKTKESTSTKKEYNKAIDKSVSILKGSVSFLEREIKLLEEKQKKLATNSDEFLKYEKAIRESKEELADFKRELESVLTELDGIDGLSSGESTDEAVKNIFNELKRDKNPKIEGLDGADDEIKAFIENERLKKQALQDTADFKKDLDEQTRDNAVAAFSESINFVNALFDAKVQKYDDEINKNNDYYATLLDNEKLTEEQRSALEAERDRKNLILEKKKREEQRKAAILNKVAGIAEVAINTAIAVSKVTAQAGIAAPLLIPSIIALGALQAATIVAQPIPQYKHGKKKGEGKDGIALLNDGGKDELKISKDGSMERITGRNVLAPVLKSDTIIPDAEKYLSNMSDKELYENLHKHSIMSSISHQNETLNAYLITQSIDKSFEKHSNKMVKAMKDSRPNIKIHNNNSIGNDLAFLASLSNTL